MNGKIRCGKCTECKVLYVWIGRPRLAFALCTRCKSPLARTTRGKRQAVPEFPLERR